MKKRKAVLAAVAATISGIVAFSVAGCVWFDFSSVKNRQTVSDSLGYEGNAGAWLASQVESPRSDAWNMYQDYLESEGITSDDFSFLDFLKAINDDSASLTSALRASVAVVMETNSAYSYGSGVIYSLQQEEEGLTAYVLTNYHVAYSSQSSSGIADRFYTYLYGDPYGTTKTGMPATYVGGSMDEDIAILKVEIPQDREDFVLAIDSNDIVVRDSDYVNVGEKVYAIGNPLGRGISVVSGIVAVEAEYNSITKIDNVNEYIDMLVMRVDAPANHGSSGGGLFDAQGRFLGLVNGGREIAVGNSSVAVAGFGYVLPADRVVSVAQSILDTVKANNSKKAYRGLLGDLQIETSKGVLDDKTQTIDIVESVKITSVDSRSPFSEQAGQIVDKVLAKVIIKSPYGEIGSKEIIRQHQVETLLYNIRKGYTVTLIFEDGSEVSAEYAEDSHFIQVK